jgi:hypothetical protein
MQNCSANINNKGGRGNLENNTLNKQFCYMNLRLIAKPALKDYDDASGLGPTPARPQL